ncbi:MAG TPA: hypothetical protein VL401_03100 [Alphaproteobacteria bacterium]|jgi:hypothetical protein|nr:hypothetical protein [Alphaproteobacteria bacterium]
MRELLIYVTIIFILLLTAININKFLQPKKQVLGIETQNTEREFWRDFVEKHPNYIPGWIELGDLDKIKQIDPNYPL